MANGANTPGIRKQEAADNIEFAFKKYVEERPVRIRKACNKDVLSDVVLIEAYLELRYRVQVATELWNNGDTEGHQELFADSMSDLQDHVPKRSEIDASNPYY
jgi:hypothetical protein